MLTVLSPRKNILGRSFWDCNVSKMLVKMAKKPMNKRLLTDF